MTNPVAVPVDRIPTLSFDDAITVGEAEQARFASVLASVRDDQWGLPTDCDLWTVRDLVGHVLGSLEVYSSMRKGGIAFVTSTIRAKRNGTEPVDEMTKAQVEAYAGVPTTELLGTFERLAPGNLAGRRRTPRPIRRIATDFDGYPLSLGELNGIVLTRDLWMHRIDLCRAIGEPFVATADHDGRIVADVVAAWAARHGQAFALRLTGPAGGAWEAPGVDATHLELDAIEFCRVLAGRGEGERMGLLATTVVF